MFLQNLALYQDHFRPFVLQIQTHRFQAFIDLTLHAFVHGLAFNGGILPFQLFDLFLQRLDPTNPFFGKVGVGDIQNAQTTQKEQELKVAEYQIGSLATNIQGIK